ncbi:hypothetical protein [Propylenella binzhouense]|uniref:hypothetical protein n=1 Tax=Propylenella binzhouense TaxID=2555902 RepID=UPI001967140E|nr:hypothetical protein [Propylenella binzhouense]
MKNGNSEAGGNRRDERKARLARALRENLKRRKTQGRDREGPVRGEEDSSHQS